MFGFNGPSPWLLGMGFLATVTGVACVSPKTAPLYNASMAHAWLDGRIAGAYVRDSERALERFAPEDQMLDKFEAWEELIWGESHKQADTATSALKWLGRYYDRGEPRADCVTAKDKTKQFVDALAHLLNRLDDRGAAIPDWVRKDAYHVVVPNC